MHELSNISRSKGNQTMKFGQLIEYNLRNIFVEKMKRKKKKNSQSKIYHLLTLLEETHSHIFCSLKLMFSFTYYNAYGSVG